uniref:NADH:ubiquinone reductase (non-electrogenic) n=1 Tax=Coccolithus braarudii TaxID=221442 RepID=A0A7S0L5Z8_9EUKA
MLRESRPHRSHPSFLIMWLSISHVGSLLVPHVSGRCAVCVTARGRQLTLLQDQNADVSEPSMSPEAMEIYQAALATVARVAAEKQSPGTTAKQSAAAAAEQSIAEWMVEEGERAGKAARQAEAAARQMAVEREAVSELEMETATDEATAEKVAVEMAAVEAKAAEAKTVSITIPPGMQGSMNLKFQVAGEGAWKVVTAEPTVEPTAAADDAMPATVADDEAAVAMPAEAAMPTEASVRSVPFQVAMANTPFIEECTYVDRTANTDKEKVVVLGSGWAAVKFLINIDTSRYDVTVVSPRNYFLFTPFLPSCVVGTVESRSIVEPIRNLLRYKSRPIGRQLKDRLAGITEDSFEEARFLESACTKIDHGQSCVYCQDVSAVAGPCDAFRVDYDKLVIAVGATSNTFNTPGVKEHAVFLKELEDAAFIRDRMLDAFESAALQEDAEVKQQLCTFVVVGAGPTGVEFAAELDDHIREDLTKLYPKEVAASRVVLISSTDDLLSSYDKKISDFTKTVLEQSRVEVVAGVRVIEVTKDSVFCRSKATKEEFVVPSSLTLWSTGVKPGRLVEEVIAAIPEQTKRSGLLVDKSMLAYGTKNVYALGDCATLYTGNAMIDDLTGLFRQADEDGNGSLDKGELLSLFSRVSNKKYPQAEVFQSKIDEDFAEIDADGSGALDVDEFKALLLNVDASLRNLPPTAQVAGQQGSFLAAQFNGETQKPFKYFHKGSMAYIGQEKAAAQVSMLKNLLPEALQELSFLGDDIVLTGGLAEVIWKFLYLDMQISTRNKLQVGFDWTKTILFGRDTSRF